MRFKNDVFFIKPGITESNEDFLENFGFKKLKLNSETATDGDLQFKIVIGKHKDYTVVFADVANTFFRDIEPSETEHKMSQKYSESTMLAISNFKESNAYLFNLIEKGERVRTKFGSQDEGIQLNFGEPLKEEKDTFDSVEIKDGEELFIKEHHYLDPRTKAKNTLLNQYRHDAIGGEMAFNICKRITGKSFYNKLEDIEFYEYETNEYIEKSKLSTNKILILGGTKFVGRQLVEELIKDKSNEVYLFNRGETNPDLFPEVHKIIGDRETDDIKQIENYKWDYIVDFSSYYPKSLANTFKYINRDVKQYIYISTISVYSFADYDSSFEINEDFKLTTCTEKEEVDTSTKTYGKRKLACENILKNQKWLNSVILRPSIIYGKYDWTDRFYYWLYRIKKEQKFILPNAGNYKLSLTYADDLSKIILETLKGKIPNGIYNCSTHPALSFKQMLEHIADELGTKAKTVEISKDYLIENKIKPQHDLPLWFGGSLMFSNALLTKVAGFKFTSFRDSIRDTITFYDELHWKEPEVGWSLEKEKEGMENMDNI